MLSSSLLIIFASAEATETARAAFCGFKKYSSLKTLLALITPRPSVKSVPAIFAGRIPVSIPHGGIWPRSSFHAANNALPTAIAPCVAIVMFSECETVSVASETLSFNFMETYAVSA